MRLNLRLASPWAVLVALMAFGTTAEVQAQTSDLTGQTSGGAHYTVRVPDGWQAEDGLVIWNHGFDLSPVGPVDDLGPLVAVQLAEGYAVAASSYSLTGWALFETVTDVEEMVSAFEQEFQTPEQILIYGASLGGIVTAQLVEQARVPNVVGALPICGAVGGSRIWDGGVDLRLIYDAVCGAVPGAAIPGGAQGLPFPPDPSFDQAAMALAVNTCTGVLQPAGTRSPDQAARLAKILAVTGLPESFLLTDMGFSTFGLADLVHDPRKLNGENPFSNSKVVYGDAEVDADIARITADQDARRFFFDHYTPSGKVGDTKIISLHTDKDGLVLVENESSYASVVPPGNFTLGIVVEEEPSHCGFTEAELLSAWELLRGWVAGLPQPTATDLQTTCQAVEAGGVSGPCRIDPGFQVPDLDVRVRRRTTCVAGEQTLCLGDGDRFAFDVNWQDRQGRTGDGQKVDLDGRSSGFWFFSPDNIELTVKMLDGRQNNGHWWVFYGSLTNVSFDLKVTDTFTDLVTVYTNPQGNFASVGDTEAF
ncbi:MAG: hypothetical protein K0U98_28445 [Deltaproteobacteria bacterium]|nr:hypothetical protein [Deltaproteobacteria bacterium]